MEEYERELDEESERSGGVDPFTQQRRPSYKVQKATALTFFLIPALAWGLMIACFAIDKATENISGRDKYTITDMIQSIADPDVNSSRSVVEASLGSMGMVFGLLITVIGIIVQLAAGRFTGQVTTLFFKDKKIGAALTYVVFSNAFAFWVYLSIGENRFIPRTATIFCLLMVNSHFALLFPFLDYIFFLLEPNKVVTKIMWGGLRAAADAINDHGRAIEIQQVKAIMAVEHLVDAAHSAIKRKDKNITAEIVDALCSFSMHYGMYKEHMYNLWYRIPTWVRRSPDFLTLSEEAIKDLKDRRTWMEWKILRQYQALFIEAMKHMKELCYHIAMNTRLIGEDAARRGDLMSLDLCLKFFNTYLRLSISGQDIRTAYNVLYQYRMLGESIIILGARQPAQRIGFHESDLEVRVARIAKYLRYYSSFVLMQKNYFLVEVIAQDMRVLCETACQNNSAVQDKLLNIFLTMDDGGEGFEEKALDGVRKAQIMLATSFLVEGRVQEALRIRDDFPDYSHKQLWSLMQELLNVTNKEFWEVSERGTNFAFMTEQQRQKLPIFMKMFHNFVSDQEVPLNDAERKQFARKQALLNFA